MRSGGGVCPRATRGQTTTVDQLDGPINLQTTAGDRHRQRLAIHLHSLGPRAVLEALLELERGTGLDVVLADYGRLDASLVHALGADRMPPTPLLLIAGGAA